MNEIKKLFDKNISHQSVIVAKCRGKLYLKISELLRQSLINVLSGQEKLSITRTNSL